MPSSADLPNPGIEPGSPALQGDSLPAALQGKSGYESNTGKLCLKWLLCKVTYGNTGWVYVCLQVVNWGV